MKNIFYSQKNSIKVLSFYISQLKTNFKTKLLSVLFLAVASYFVLAQPSSRKPLSDAELRKYQYCKVDSDCVHVQNGHCDCANGGREAWINKKYKEEFSKLFVSRPCTELATDGWTCGDGIPQCVNSLCVFPTKGRPSVAPTYREQ
jgi:hypothetical protein